MSREESQEAYSSRIPIFDGTNYAFWKVRMEVYLMFLGVDVWTSILLDYNVLDILPINEDRKKLYGSNDKDNNSILLGLSQSEFVKVMHCKNAKKVWESLIRVMKEMTKSTR